MLGVGLVECNFLDAFTVKSHRLGGIESLTLSHPLSSLPKENLSPRGCRLMSAEFLFSLIKTMLS